MALKEAVDNADTLLNLSTKKISQNHKYCLILTNVLRISSSISHMILMSDSSCKILRQDNSCHHHIQQGQGWQSCTMIEGIFLDLLFLYALELTPFQETVFVII